MSNREIREPLKFIHLFLAFKRCGSNRENQCIRSVIRNYDQDLASFEARIRSIGGKWRIHKTVNARCPEKALKLLMKTLIDHPEKASTVDQEWRTALLKPECIYGSKLFMLDIDTQEEDKLLALNEMIDQLQIVDKIKSPKGWHYITRPFDTREICKLEYVTLLRDGYSFVKEIDNEQG
jgi:hypothetical protein